jgi:hypothetical protein
MIDDHRMRRAIALTITLLVNQLTLCDSRDALASWPSDGVPLLIHSDEDPLQELATDGNSGVIVAWKNFDEVYEIFRVFAQRISSAGDTYWMNGGVPMTSTVGHQYDPAITHDGAGGAYVAWSDLRGNTSCCSNARVFVQRLDPAGAALWAENGVPVRDDPGQGSPVIVPDGASGCIVMWRGSATVSTQRFDPTGVKQWSTDGIPICTGCYTEQELVAISDGNDGAIIVWVNNNLGFQRLFAQRIRSSGDVAWVAGGVLLSESASMKYYPEIATDDAGGAFITWSDYNGGSMRALIQHVSPEGTTRWPPEGYRISDADTWQSSPSPAEDGTGGVIVSWQEYDNGLPWKVLAQRIDQVGQKQWGPNGIPVCSVAGSQGRSSAHADGSGGAIVMFLDDRIPAGAVTGQRLGPDGELLWAGEGVVFGPGWLSNYGPTAISDGAGGSILVRQVATPTWRELFVHRTTATGTTPTSVPRAPTSTLIVGSPTPNPFSTTTSFDFEAQAQSGAHVEVYDVTGTRVWDTEVTGQSSRSGKLYFEGRDYTGRLLPSGVYFYRVKAAGETITRKMVIAR